MVAIVAGNGLGLFNASLNVLGGGVGQSGSAKTGQTQGSGYVNVATGNLILQALDEQRSGLGGDLYHLRTYNSLGQLNDADGDGWRWDGERKVVLSGTVNTVGSTVTRTTGDGHETIYSWDATNSRYASSEGDGAHDTLTWDSATSKWSWVDGSTRTVEAYTGSTGRLESVTDTTGNTITYGYDANGRLNLVKDNGSGQELSLSYDANGRAQSVATRSSSSGSLVRQVYYEYDSGGRLSSVTADLSPDDDSKVDGKVFTTTYGYDGTSFRVASITQSDGTAVGFAYILVGSDYRVQTVTDSNGTTTYSYDTANRRTDVTDALGQQWTYTYNTANQLVEVKTPAVNGQRLTTTYVYDAEGNVTQVADGQDDVVAYQYDANGNRILERDAAGNTVNRTFDANNQLVNETQFTAAALKATGTALYFNDLKDNTEGLNVAATPSIWRDADKGRLVLNNSQSATTSYPKVTSSLQVAQSSGALFSSVLTTGSVSTNRNVEVGIVGSGASGTANYRRLIFKITGGTLYASTYTPALSSVTLGSVQNDTSYNVEFELSSGGLIGYFYVVGQTREQGFQYDFDYRDIGDARWFFQGQVNPSYTGLAETYVDDIKISPWQWSEPDASTSQTTRYVYDSSSRLRFTVDPEGLVTQYVYGSNGLRSKQIKFTGAAYDISALQTTSTLSETDLANWSALQTASKTELTTYEYDAFGNLSKTTVFNSASAVGTGTSSSGAIITEYVYDLYSRLLQTIAVRGSSRTEKTTLSSVVYDGIGRVQSELNASGTTAYSYDGVARQLAMTNTAGLTTTQTFDARGRLISIVQSASGETSRTTTYTYDAAGRLVMSQDPVGARSYVFYDEAGRVNGRVDGAGALVEYAYSASGEITKELRYATLLDTSSWYDGTSVIKTQLSQVRPALHADDRSVQYSFDASGRLSDMTDAAGIVTSYEYDAAGRLLKTTTADRVSRFFYDRAGRQIGLLDAEGYLTENAYNQSGRLIRVRRHATLTTESLRADGTLDELRPTNSTYRSTWYYYSQSGRLIGELDEKQFLTAYAYDEASNQQTVTRYGKAYTSSVGTTTSYSTILSGVSAGGTGFETSQITTTYYDSMGRVLKVVNPEGTITQNEYDTAGRLVRSTAADTLPAARSTRTRYNAFGEVVGVLSGSDAARVTVGMTETQIAAVFAGYGSRYVYDAAGRQARVTDRTGRVTVFYYDGANRLTHTINNAGEVNESQYNAFGQVKESTALTARLSTADTTSQLQTGGGVLSTSVKNLIAAIRNASKDARTQFSYNSRGLLASKTDAEGYVTSYSYTNYGQLESETRTLQQSPASTAVTQYSYDKLGLLLSTTVDPTGLNIVRSQTYDAFGRVVTQTDSLGKVTSTAFSNSGRTISVTDPLGRVVATSYDAWDRTLSVTDATGNVTTYAYDQVARSVTVTTPEGITSKTTRTVHGETFQLTDGAGGTTSYAYDVNGQLLTVTDAKSVVTQSNTYDATTSELSSTTDALGNVVTLSYDAAGRVLTRSNAGTKNLTRYEYDGQGRQVTVTEEEGASVLKKTTYAYDRLGRVLTVTTDPTGLALTTTYTYDGEGRQLTVSQGDTASPNQQQVSYSYDKAGRLISETRDSSGLNLTTQYKYDSEGRLSRKIDALGNSVWYAYDTTGKLAYEVVAVGSTSGEVTRYIYDANYRQISTIKYINRVTVSSYGDVVTSSGVSVTANAERDQQTWQVYDRDGRVIYRIDALKHITEYRYDAAGNVIETIRHNQELLTPDTELMAQAFSDTSYTGLSNTSYLTTYPDILAIANGCLTIKSPSGTTSDPSLVYGGSLKFEPGYTFKAEVKTGAVLPSRISIGVNNEGTSTAKNIVRHWLEVKDGKWQVYYYSNAGSAYVELCAAEINTPYVVEFVSRAGGTTAYLYKKVGQTRETGYKYDFDASGWDELRFTMAGHRASGYNGGSVEVDNLSIQKRTSDVIDGVRTRYVYDTLNRQRYEIDALGYVTEWSYDAAGNMASKRRFDKAIALDTAANETAIQAALTAAGATTSPPTTTYLYDTAGRLVYTVDALRQATQNVYDAMGQVIETRRFADPVSSTVALTYSAVDTALTQPSPKSNWSTKFVYDVAGRVVYSIDALKNVTQNVYDDMGRVVQQKRFTVQLSEIPATLDSKSVEQALGTTASISTYTVYDALGRTRYVIDALLNVTERVYDAVGNVTKEQRFLNVLSALPTLTATSVESAVAARNPASTDKSSTQYVYDKVGRLRFTIDALGYVSESRYNALGQIVAKRRYATVVGSASLTDSNLTTLYTNDTETNKPRQTLRYVYDVLGRLRYALDDLGYVTETIYDAQGNQVGQKRYANKITATFPSTSNELTELTEVWVGSNLLASTDDTSSTSTYDALGRKTSTTDDYLNSVHYNYDAFGNVISLTDQRGNTGYFYFDAINRQVASIDPEGYLTEQTYTKLGPVDKVTRYANKVVGTIDVNTRPKAVTAATTGAYVIKDSSRDAVTDYDYDSLGRMTKKTDAEAFYESWAYNAKGQQTSYRNKLGGTFSYTFDDLNRLLTEKAPELSGGKSVTNKYEYDGFGNRTKVTEASALSEQRVTTYQYDLNGQLTATVSESVSGYVYTPGVTNDATRVTLTTPTASKQYDSRGNVILETNANGGKTFSYYDKRNLKTAEVNAVGALTQWDYDAAGNMVAMRIYGTAVSLPSTAGGTAPSPVAGSTVREIQYQYDKLGRQVGSTLKNATFYDEIGGAYVLASGDIQTTTTYDAAGNVVKEVDGRGNAAYTYYDKAGRKVLAVDRENYVIAWQYRSGGQTETRYADIFNTSDSELEAALVGGTAQDALLQRLTHAPHSNNPDNRITETDFDRLGRVKEVRVLNVAYGTVNTSGVLAEATGTATTSYVLDGMGNITQQTDANGTVTNTTFDKMGRETLRQSSTFTDISGASVRQRLSTTYNGLGLVTKQSLLGTNDAVTTDDRTTSYVYDKLGRRIEEYDNLNQKTEYGYDAAGNQTLMLQARNDADGNSITDGTFLVYNALGQETARQTRTYTTTGGWVSGEVRETRYNTYKEVTGKRLSNSVGGSGIWQETAEYNVQGKVWRSNSSGATQIFAYDRNGNATLQLNSAGEIDLSTQSLGMALTGVTYTETHYDARNLAMQVIQPDADQTWQDAQVQLFSQVVSRSEDRGSISVSGDSTGRLKVAGSPSKLQLTGLASSTHKVFLTYTPSGQGDSGSVEMTPSTSTAGAYTLDWAQLPEGTYTLEYLARDAAGTQVDQGSGTYTRVAGTGSGYYSGGGTASVNQIATIPNGLPTAGELAVNNIGLSTLSAKFNGTYVQILEHIDSEYSYVSVDVGSGECYQNTAKGYTKFVASSFELALPSLSGYGSGSYYAELEVGGVKYTSAEVEDSKSKISISISGELSGSYVVRLFKKIDGSLTLKVAESTASFAGRNSWSQYDGWSETAPQYDVGSVYNQYAGSIYSGLEMPVYKEVHFKGLSSAVTRLEVGRRLSGSTVDFYKEQAVKKTINGTAFEGWFSVDYQSLGSGDYELEYKGYNQVGEVVVYGKAGLAWRDGTTTILAKSSGSPTSSLKASGQVSQSGTIEYGLVKNLPTLKIYNENSSATRLYFKYKGYGIKEGFKELVAENLTPGGNASFNVDISSLGWGSKYEFEYFAVSEKGVLNHQSGIFNYDTFSPSVQTANAALGGDGFIVFDRENKISFIDQASGNLKGDGWRAVLKVRREGELEWEPEINLALHDSSVPGWFTWEYGMRMGDYEYVIETFDSSAGGAPVNKIMGCLRLAYYPSKISGKTYKFKALPGAERLEITYATYAYRWGSSTPTVFDTGIVYFDVNEDGEATVDFGNLTNLKSGQFLEFIVSGVCPSADGGYVEIGSAWGALDGEYQSGQLNVLSAPSSFDGKDLTESIVVKYLPMPRVDITVPSGAQSVTVRYRKAGTTAYTSQNISVKNGLASWYPSAVVDADPFVAASIEYEYTTYGSSNWTGAEQYRGKGLIYYAGDGTASISHENGARPAWVNMASSETSATSMTVYYRRTPVDDRDAYADIDDWENIQGFDKVAIARNSDGEFRWDTTSLVPSSGFVDYQYFYELLDAQGNVLSRTPGYITLYADGTGEASQIKQVLTGTIDDTNQIIRYQQHNAFGEVITETDGNLNATNLRYNTLGKLIEKKSPEVEVTLENGFIDTQRPTIGYVYDKAGRLVSAVDANGNRTNWTYKDALNLESGESLVAQEFRAVSGNVQSNYYDAMGQLVAQTDGLGLSQYFSYDGAGLLWKISGKQSGALQAAYTGTWRDEYSYDAKGNRISHKNVLGFTDKTYYDSLERVTKYVDAFGTTTTTSYVFDSSIWGGGIVDFSTGVAVQKAVGGYRRTVTDANGKSLIDEIDYFQRTSKHTDMENRVFSYEYDRAGHLLKQTGDSGQNIEYEYYSNGYIKAIKDKGLNNLSKYAYDNNGNRTLETYTDLEATQGDPQIYQSANISYDALNRVKTISDATFSIQYEYDANSNIRHLYALFNDGVSGQQKEQDFWYKYDSLNRFTVTMGELSGGRGSTATDTAGHEIVYGSKGVFVQYDNNDRRVLAIYGANALSSTDGPNAHREDYRYSNDGYLEKVYINTSNLTAEGVLRTQRTNDDLGRTKVYREYDEGGTTVTKEQTTAYRSDNQIDWQTTDGIKTTFNYEKGLLNNSVYSVTANNTTTTYTTTYTYEYWDSAKQLEIKRQANTQSAPGWRPGWSSFTYDKNGHVKKMEDKEAGRTQEYVNNAQGLILRRSEEVSGRLNRYRNFFYLNGKRIGDISNDGPSREDYAQSLKGSNQQTDYKNFKPISSADFDQNFEPISAEYPGQSATSYTVGRGDSLRSIALSVWGDEAMWYLLAEANGLTTSDELIEGQTLVIPNKVTNIHNNSKTFRPYNAGEAMGDTQPTLPDPPPPPRPKKKCGVLAAIVMVIVAVVATVMTAGAAAAGIAALSGASSSAVLAGGVWAAGTAALGGAVTGMGAIAGGFAAMGAAFIGGAVGSAASQLAGMAMGVVEDFSWRQVAAGGLTSAFTAGFGSFGMFGDAQKAATAVRSGKLANMPWSQIASGYASGAVLSYGASYLSQKAAGLETHFSWSSVGSAGVNAFVGDSINHVATSQFDMVDGIVTQQLTAAAGARINDKWFGGSKPDYLQVSAQAFGSWAGNGVGSLLPTGEAAPEGDATDALDSPSFADSQQEYEAEIDRVNELQRQAAEGEYGSYAANGAYESDLTDRNVLPSEPFDVTTRKRADKVASASAKNESPRQIAEHIATLDASYKQAEIDAYEQARDDALSRGDIFGASSAQMSAASRSLSDYASNSGNNILLRAGASLIASLADGGRIVADSIGFISNGYVMLASEFGLLDASHGEQARARNEVMLRSGEAAVDEVKGVPTQIKEAYKAIRRVTNDATALHKLLKNMSPDAIRKMIPAGGSTMDIPVVQKVFEGISTDLVRATLASKEATGVLLKRWLRVDISRTLRAGELAEVVATESLARVGQYAGVYSEVGIGALKNSSNQGVDILALDRFVDRYVAFEVKSTAKGGPARLSDTRPGVGNLPGQSEGPDAYVTARLVASVKGHKGYVPERMHPADYAFAKQVAAHWRDHGHYDFQGFVVHISNSGNSKTAQSNIDTWRKTR